MSATETVTTSIDSSFAAPHPDRVGSLARSGSRWAVTSLFLRQAISVSSTVVLARLLTPHDYGLMAMVTSLTGFLLLAADMGLTWGTVQARELDHDRATTLFWTTCTIGLGAAACCVLAAPRLGQFYGNSELIAICDSMAVLIFVSNLSIVPMALIRRQIRQKSISLIQLTATLVGTGAAVVTAVLGGRYWSLVVQLVLPSVTVVACAFYVTRFRPGVPRHLKRALPVLSFGGFAGCANLVNYFQYNADTIAVGYFCGAEQTGIFSRAALLRSLPMVYAVAVFQDIMLPSLVALREDKDRFAAAYRKGLKAIAFVWCPLATWFGVTAPELIRVLYGEQWSQVIPLLAWLALPGTVLPVQITVAWLFLSTGHARELFRQTIVATPLIVAAVLVGVRWGPHGVVIASAVVFTVPLTLATLWFGHRVAGIDLRRTLSAVMPTAVGCAAAAAVALAAGVTSQWTGAPWYVTYAAKTLSGAVVYVGTVYWLEGGLPVPWSFSDSIRHVRVNLARIQHQGE